MIGVVLVTHGRIGTELIAGAIHVLGPQRLMSSIEVRADDSLELIHRRVDDTISKMSAVQSVQGILLMTDMVGGTPCNVAMRASRDRGVAVVTGANLPMLITVAKARRAGSLSDVSRAAVTAGRRYIDELSCAVPAGGA